MKTAIALTTLLLAAGGTQAAELLVNGGFESDAGFTTPFNDGNDLLDIGSTLMPGWTVINAALSWARDDNPYGASNPLPNDHYVLDLTGYEHGLGGVAQTFATVAGSVYNVSFQTGIGGSGARMPSSLTEGPVSFGVGVTHASGLPCCDFQTVAGEFAVAVWETMSFSFTAAGTSSTLSIFGTSRGPNNSVFMGLDNVSVTGLAVPEPASVVLALLGLGVVGVARLRQRGQTAAGADGEDRDRLSAVAASRRNAGTLVPN